MSDQQSARKQQREDVLKKIGTIAKDMGRAIVPVWTFDAAGGRGLLGSAFFAVRGGRQLLLTALHNFLLNEGCDLYITIGGTDYLLNEMSGRRSASDDLWWCEIKTGGPLAASLGEIALPALKCDSAQQCRFGCGVVLCGFPGRLPGQNFPFKLFSFSAAMACGPLTIEHSIVEAVVYDLGEISLVHDDGSAAIDRPDVPGMSGGPAFGWILLPVGDDEIDVVWFLQGMITSWRKSAKYVVACNAGRIAEVVDAIA